MSDAQALLDRISQFVDEDAFAAHAIQVRLAGVTAARRWSPDVRRDIHSIAKGICVLAVGIACDEGHFDLDASVQRYLPELATGRGAAAVTIRRLLGMTSGIDLPWSASMMTDWPDLAGEYLSRPSEGRVFQYSNASTYTAMRALEVAVGDVHSYLQPRLFAPLGIEAPNWDRCPNGHVLAGEGLHLLPDELARIGQLIADHGRYDGARLVNPNWIRAMHTDWTVREAAPGYTHYALAGWGGPGNGWRLHGAYGQMLIFTGGAIVTVVADDHLGSDRMAARIADACRSS